MDIKELKSQTTAKTKGDTIVDSDYSFRVKNEEDANKNTRVVDTNKYLLEITKAKAENREGEAKLRAELKAELLAELKAELSGDKPAKGVK